MTYGIHDSTSVRQFKMDEICAACGCRWGLHIGMQCPNGDTSFVPVIPPMEGVPPTLRIGRFTLRRFDAKSIWIENEDGEGGQFSEEAVEAALREMYKRYF